MDMITLLQGDCIDHLRRMKDGCADVILTDPPYGHAYKSKKYGGMKNDELPYIWWLYEAFRVCKNPGVLICFYSMNHWSMAWKYAIQVAGFKNLSHGTWVKGGAGTFASKNRPAYTHERFYIATKGKYMFPGKRPADTYTVQKVASANMIHACEKPVELMRQILRDYCKPSGLVVDPFMGSASVGLACRELGLQYVGVELDAKYYKVACGRLPEIKPVKPIKVFSKTVVKPKKASKPKAVKAQKKSSMT
jgi:DNA modification methylase